MAIRNVNGHAVSSVAPGDHQVAGKATLPNMAAYGPSGYNMGGAGGGKGGGNFPPARGNQANPKGKPALGQTGVAWAPGAGKNP